MKKQKVIVLEDSSQIHKMISDMYNKDCYQIIKANNMKEVLECYNNEKTDIITIDTTIDKDNRLATIKNILAKNKEAKIIMISAIGQEKYINEGLNSGVKDIIVKPYTHARLKKAFNKLFALAF